MTFIRDITDNDREWLLANTDPLGGPEVVSGGVLHRLRDHPAVISESDGARSGYAVFRPGAVRWEILGIMSIVPRKGTGSALLDHVEAMAKSAGAAQIRLSTTNDNFPAMRFCQLRGYRFRQLIPGAFLESKKLRGIPRDLPVLGNYGIEIRDEIILNKDL